MKVEIKIARLNKKIKELQLEIASLQPPSSDVEGDHDYVGDDEFIDHLVSRGVQY